MCGSSSVLTSLFKQMIAVISQFLCVNDRDLYILYTQHNQTDWIASPTTKKLDHELGEKNLCGVFNSVVFNE